MIVVRIDVRAAPDPPQSSSKQAALGIADSRYSATFRNSQLSSQEDTRDLVPKTEEEERRGKAGAGAR